MIQGAGQYKGAMANPCGRKTRKFHKSRSEPSGAEDGVEGHEVDSFLANERGLWQGSEENQVRYPAQWEDGLQPNALTGDPGQNTAFRL